MRNIDIILTEIKEKGSILYQEIIETRSIKTFWRGKMGHEKVEFFENESLKSHVTLEPKNAQNMSIVTLQIKCNELFLNYPLSNLQPINGTIDVHYHGGPYGPEGRVEKDTEVINVSIKFDMDIPAHTFEFVEEHLFFEVNHIDEARDVTVCNASELSQFCECHLKGDIAQMFNINYPKQEGTIASSVVSPSSKLPLTLSVKRHAQSGTYRGSVVVKDVFGNQNERPIEATIDLPAHSFTDRLRKRKERKRRKEMEDALINFASQNNGIISQDELIKLSNDFSVKELMTTLKRLESEGLVERSEGVFIFTQLVDF